MKKEYTYNDISLFSRKISTVKSRFSNEILLDNVINFGNGGWIRAGFIMSAPMYDITGFNLSVKLHELGQLPIVHRFLSPQNQLKLFMDTVRFFNYDKDMIFSYTVGINDCAEKIKYLQEFVNTLSKEQGNGLKILICIDTANGANILLERPAQIINDFKSKNKKILIEILSGNVVTKEGSKFLYDLGIKFQRVSISTGSACSTSVVTGIYRPPISAIMEIHKMRQREGIDDLYIIADGGFKETSDMIKAIAVGADFIMSGSSFAGYMESNSPLLVNKNGVYEELIYKTPEEYLNNLIAVDNIYYTVRFTGDFYKHYRGMASEQMAYLNNNINNIDKKILPEGVSTYIKYRHNLEEDVQNIFHSFKSSMSYTDSLDFEEFRNNIEIVEITNNSLIQRRPHV